MKYLGLDLGGKHTGIAISYEGKIAQGFQTMETDSQDVVESRVKNLVDQEQIDVVVIGQPETGIMKEVTRQFAQRLQTLGIKTVLVNEDFTSREAVSSLIASGQKKMVRRVREHEVAAAAVLQRFLDDLVE